MSKEPSPSDVKPKAKLLKLEINQIKPSQNNPRHLFDIGPLDELKKNIKSHGVLVPITVYELKGQGKYVILDGERRYRCCVELSKEGIKRDIPANVVEPPDPMAGLLYMFSIHNYREQWELMPTALSLKLVMEGLGESENTVISKLTGLSEPQIERCKKLLLFPEKFQNMSLEVDPKIRIPSNFWIEIFPVLELCDRELPDFVAKNGGRNKITEKLVDKYRNKKIKSVIHFRRIIEAFEVTDGPARHDMLKQLKAYILDVDLETRHVFDRFVVDNRRIKGAIGACDEFIKAINKSKIENAIENDRSDMRVALTKVRDYVNKLLEKLKGEDEPKDGADE